MKNDWKTIFTAARSEITAIDILLQPDAMMLRYAADNNARLLKVYPRGFALDEAHTPHITMLQCFVRTADLEKVYAATDASLIQYVSTFVPKMSEENFNPHVSTGVAPTAYLDQMLEEPFERFTFSPTGAAVYQLGPFGTAAKKLKQFDLKP